MKREKATEIATEIISLYEIYGGSEYAGEPVTQLEHMLQAAALARKEEYDDEVVLSAFLHDIGHISEKATIENGMDGYGIMKHEEIGAEFLKEKGFSERIVRLVGSHVEAKRYLTYIDDSYFNQLSDASRITLEHQGGPMGIKEAIEFENDPLFSLIVKMRKWDDEAKLVDVKVLPLEYFRELIISHLQLQPA